MKRLAFAFVSVLLLGAVIPKNTPEFHPDQLTTVGDLVYFEARDNQGIGLWKTDGTGPGTVLVKRLLAIHGPNQLTGLRGVGGSLFFFVDHGALLGYKKPLELWKSDGTATGTQRIVNLGPHPQEGFVAAAIRNRLYFGFDDGIHGSELWVSDGTEPGTKIVKDLNPGPGGSNPQDFQELNGKLVFSAVSASSQRGLYSSNGTPSGTVLLTQWGSGFDIREMTPFGSDIYFTVNSLLWKTSGTPGGTELVSGNYFGVRELTVFRNSLYFVTDGASDTQLLRMDKDESFHLIRSDPSSCRCAPYNLAAVPSYLLFMDYVKDKGNALWRTTGTKEGVSPVRAIGGGGFNILRPVNTIIGSALMNYTRHDQLDLLWISNGDPAGTYPLSSPLGSFDPNRPSGSVSTAILKGLFIYSAGKWNPDGYYDFGGHLWRSDGTVEGTYVLR